MNIIINGPSALNMQNKAIHTLITAILGIILCGTAQAQEIAETGIRNRKGNMEMSVIDYGARIKALKVNGTDVVLGFDDNTDYTRYKQNFGAIVGRYIGRIVGGEMAIDGTKHRLQTGANGDCSHGGTPGFAQRQWTITSRNDTAVALRYISPDGENGFPGELTLVTRYTLTDDALRIDYTATTTKPTVLNPSNHSFFNISGVHDRPILGERLWINAGEIAVYDSNKRVTGRMMDITGGPFDFTEPRAIGDSIDADNDQLRVTRGYDHCYKLRTEGDISIPAARITDTESGLAMEVYTTEPALQIYTANGHNGSLTGKDGRKYVRRNAICFETMHFPDSPNKPQWPSTVLRPGETFRSTTIYRFLPAAEK